MGKSIIKNMGISLMLYLVIIFFVLLVIVFNSGEIDIYTLSTVLDIRIMAFMNIFMTFALSIVDASNRESDRIIERRLKLKEEEEKKKKEEAKKKEEEKPSVIRQTLYERPYRNMEKVNDKRLEQQLELARQNRLGGRLGDQQ